MNHCLKTGDLERLGDSIFAGFDTRVAALPKDMCAPFREEARQLEAELLTIYKFVVMFVQKMETTDTDSLNPFADAWSSMVKLCDQAASKQSALASQHPQCGANEYFDRVLDLRNKCLRLQQMHS